MNGISERTILDINKLSNKKPQLITRWYCAINILEALYMITVNAWNNSSFPHFMMHEVVSEQLIPNVYHHENKIIINKWNVDKKLKI